MGSLQLGRGRTNSENFASVHYLKIVALQVLTDPEAPRCPPDVVVLDLEDTVHETRKHQARERFKDAIPKMCGRGAEVFVRSDPELVHAALKASVWRGLTDVVLDQGHQCRAGAGSGPAPGGVRNAAWRWRAPSRREGRGGRWSSRRGAGLGDTPLPGYRPRQLGHHQARRGQSQGPVGQPGPSRSGDGPSRRT